MKIQQIIDNLNNLKQLFVVMLKMMPQGEEIVLSLSNAIEILEKEQEYLEEKYD